MKLELSLHKCGELSDQFGIRFLFLYRDFEVALIDLAWEFLSF